MKYAIKVIQFPVKETAANEWNEQIKMIERTTKRSIRFEKQVTAKINSRLETVLSLDFVALIIKRMQNRISRHFLSDCETSIKM